MEVQKIQKIPWHPWGWLLCSLPYGHVSAVLAGCTECLVIESVQANQQDGRLDIYFVDFSLILSRQPGHDKEISLHCE